MTVSPVDLSKQRQRSFPLRLPDGGATVSPPGSPLARPPALAVVAVLVSAPSVVAACGVALALYLVVIHHAGDRLLAVAAVDLAALLVTLAIERQRLLHL